MVWQSESNEETGFLFSSWVSPVIEEVLGYRLVEGQYLPLTPDDDGRIL
ncbi:hypothetical protein [Microseira sp. BLCC-F43]